MGHRHRLIYSDVKLLEQHCAAGSSILHTARAIGCSAAAVDYWATKLGIRFVTQRNDKRKRRVDPDAMVKLRATMMRLAQSNWTGMDSTDACAVLHAELTKSGATTRTNMPAQ
jgi:hypothetical protein